MKESWANSFIITALEIRGFEIQLILEMSTVSLPLSSLPKAFKPLTYRAPEINRYNLKKAISRTMRIKTSF